jgi:hypothetical protein
VVSRRSFAMRPTPIRPWFRSPTPSYLRHGSCSVPYASNERFTLNTITQLARVVRERPDDQLALKRLLDAVRAEKQVAALGALLQWWGSVQDGVEPTEALCALYCRMAERSSPDIARQLARAALIAMPAHTEALLIFERYARREDHAELCEHYESFLRHAPFSAVSPRVRVSLIDRLLESGRYVEAAEHVQKLPPRHALRPVRDEMARACEVPAEPVKPQRSQGDLTLVLEEDDIEVVWQEEAAGRVRHSEIRFAGETVPVREDAPRANRVVQLPERR